MLSPKYTSQFKKDYKKYKFSGRYDIKELNEVILKLVQEKPLAEKYNDHPLKGHLADFSGCHIQPDWLLMYKIDSDIIIFTRTGSHSELFE